jgi:hypothetical protein
MNRKYKLYLVAMLMFLPPMWVAFGVGNYAYLGSKCDVSDVPNGWYMAFCRGYGDYEHQAAYYGLSGVARGLAQSSILFLGDSRLQYAFSRKNTTDFFAKRGAAFYIDGFGYNGKWQFSNMVLRQNNVKPKIMVINIDPFFEDGLNETESFVADHKLQAFIDAEFKAIVQRTYIFICRQKASCPGPYAVISRSPDTGQWRSRVLNDEFMDKVVYPIVAPPQYSAAELEAWLNYAAPAASIISGGVERNCVVLTSIPNNFTLAELGKALADRIGAQYLSPSLPDLHTSDTSHLDAESASAWSNEFLRMLDPIGRQCGAWE